MVRHRMLLRLIAAGLLALSLPAALFEHGPAPVSAAAMVGKSAVLTACDGIQRPSAITTPAP